MGIITMMPEKEIFCPRCQNDQIGRALYDCYTNLGLSEDEWGSYLYYECDNCDCVFLIKDDYLSPGEQAERAIIKAKLDEGGTPASIAKDLGMDPSKVSDIVKSLQKTRKKGKKTR
jgi:DNA-binding MarR family transcriptional regulator